MLKFPTVLVRIVAAITFIAIVFSPALVVNAQLSGCSNVCGDGQPFNFTPESLIGERIYFSIQVQSLQEFEYRLIANDNKPLGLLEIYDYDEADADGRNFECFAQNTRDNTTCPNQYLANGQTQPILAKREANWGFMKCPDYNASVHSRDMSLRVFYRPLLPLTPYTDQIPICSNLTRAEPTKFCSAGALASQVVSAMCVFVLMMFFM